MTRYQEAVAEGKSLLTRDQAKEPTSDDSHLDELDCIPKLCLCNPTTAAIIILQASMRASNSSHAPHAPRN